MSELHALLLKLTKLSEMPDVIDEAKRRDVPLFLSSNKCIQWTARPVDIVPATGCRDAGKFNLAWHHWRRDLGKPSGGVVLKEHDGRYGYKPSYVAGVYYTKPYYELPPNVVVLSLHQLLRNARRVLDPMILTKDWETPTKCFLTHQGKPLAVIRPGVRL